MDDLDLHGYITWPGRSWPKDLAHPRRVMRPCDSSQPNHCSALHHLAPLLIHTIPIMSDPRPSTDEETAPLLDHERRNDSFFSALTHPTRKLTNLEKLLGVLAVVLLLLASTFIGLFAGAQHKLNNDKSTGGWHTSTATVTATRTASHSASSTSGHPAPTGAPAQVSDLTYTNALKLTVGRVSDAGMCAPVCPDLAVPQHLGRPL